jgi:hypothetical protein
MDRDRSDWLDQNRPSWPPEDRPDAYGRRYESGYDQAYGRGYERDYGRGMPPQSRSPYEQAGQQRSSYVQQLSEHKVVAGAATLGLGALVGLAAYALMGSSSSGPQAKRQTDYPRLPDDAPGRTAKQANFGNFKVTGRAVTINRPRQEIYAFWRDFRNLAQFMENIEDASEIEPGISQWKIRAPLGMTMTVKSRIVNDARASRSPGGPPRQPDRDGRQGHLPGRPRGPRDHRRGACRLQAAHGRRGSGSGQALLGRALGPVAPRPQAAQDADGNGRDRHQRQPAQGGGKFQQNQERFHPAPHTLPAV